MRQPAAGCNAPAAIVTAVAQFVHIGDATPATCAVKPIDYSYSLGYHVSTTLCAYIPVSAALSTVHFLHGCGCMPRGPQGWVKRMQLGMAM